MDEKLLRNNYRGNGMEKDAVDRTLAVNDMYLGAIQAKLKILD